VKITMRSDGRVETRGHLDSISIEDGVLILGGWAFSAERSIDSFRVTCGDQACDNIDVTMNIPSADVSKPWVSTINLGRGLPRAAMAQLANCRFRIRVPLPNGAVQERIRTSIIGVTPLVGRLQGNLLLGIIEPFLPIPPQEHIDSVGGGCYEGVSAAVLGHLIQWSGLRPDIDVLDAGCGVGRIAHSLVHYLNPTARYEGFDVALPLVRWAQDNITARFHNFNFRRVDIYNKVYNPGGSIQGAEFCFPYEDESFDFVFSTSLFTHLLAADAHRYLDETYRVLRPGGRCFHTFFLLNQESESLIRAGKSSLNLVHAMGECFVHSAESPEGAVGYPERRMLKYIAKRGFTLRKKYLGEWCGRPERQFYQDVLILEKRPRRRFWSIRRRAG
jgi:SAM-dependent methyltransferase